MALRRPGDRQRRAQRRVRAPAGGVRHGADVVRRDPARAAGTSTSASRTWTPTASWDPCASRRSHSSAASSSPAPRTRTSPWPCCRPTTTGTSTIGAAPTPVASSRACCPRSGIPRCCAAEVRRTAAKGAHAVTFSENPSKLGWPSIHSDHWDPFWTACSDENVVVCMHIGSSSQLVDHGTRRPHRLPDHAHAHEHRAGGGRPGVVAGAAQVPRV